MKSAFVNKAILGLHFIEAWILTQKKWPDSIILGVFLQQVFLACLLFRCIFHNFVTWRTEYSQGSWDRQLVQTQLGHGLSLPWDAATLLSPCIHCLDLKNFWLEYEIQVLLLLVSDGLCDGVGTFCCHTEQGGFMWASGERVKSVSSSPTAVLGHPEDSDSNEKRCTGGNALTGSSKCLNSCAESQMRGIPHTPVLLLLFPGIWHRNNQLGFSKHYH